MQIQDVLLIVSLAINLVTLTCFIVQTRYLAAQTKSLIKGLEYASYQKLMDYTNIVSLQLLENPQVADVFKEISFIKQGLAGNPGMSIEKIGLAWLVINRYEAAFVGHQAGMISQEEWQVWIKRLKKDLQIPFIRDVWYHDIRNFDYNKGFKEMLEEMLTDVKTN